MNLHRQTRVAASGGVLLALIGLFLGHTLEYLRVWGPTGIVESITNPVHAYMLPVAGVLLALGAVFALRLARAWQALNARLDRAAAGVRRILRGRDADVSVAPTALSTPGTRLVAIWLPLATAQTALYLVQENIEAVARSQPAPGLGAITGIHWAAPFVHLYVSLLLACVVRICEILFRRREIAVERVEALLRVIARRRRSCRSFHPPSRCPRRLAARPAGTAPLAKATAAAPRHLTGVCGLRLTNDPFTA